MNIVARDKMEEENDLDLSFPGCQVWLHLFWNLPVNVAFIHGYLAEAFMRLNFQVKAQKKGLDFCFWAPEMTTFICGLEKRRLSIWINVVMATRSHGMDPQPPYPAPRPPEYCCNWRHPRTGLTALAA